MPIVITNAITSSHLQHPIFSYFYFIFLITFFFLPSEMTKIPSNIQRHLHQRDAPSETQVVQCFIQIGIA